MTPEGVDRLFDRLGTLAWKIFLVFLVAWLLFGLGALLQRIF
jgi:hypothetical protein